MRGTKAKRLRRAGLKSGPQPRTEEQRRPNMLMTACLQCGKVKKVDQTRICSDCTLSTLRKAGHGYYKGHNSNIKKAIASLVRRSPSE